MKTHMGIELNITRGCTVEVYQFENGVGVGFDCHGIDVCVAMDEEAALKLADDLRAEVTKRRGAQSGEPRP